MTTLALHHLWQYIDSLSLPQRDRNWLADKLIGKEKEETRDERNNTKRKHHRPLDPDLQWIADNPISLTEDELNDERTKYIMNK
ncbi:MAG: hypothetical protein IJK87_08525 [Prevotella sp.]|nr:hypothetical protein [Prevotella sp.]